MAVDRLAEDGVRLDDQNELLPRRLGVVVEPVVQRERLVVRCVMVMHVVVFRAAIVGVHMSRADVCPGIALRMVARHQPRHVSWLQHLLVRIEDARRLPVKVRCAFGREDRVNAALGSGRWQRDEPGGATHVLDSGRRASASGAVEVELTLVVKVYT